MSLKVAFAGTPEFAVPTLKALLSSDHDVCAVWTQPDRPAGRGQHLHKSPIKELAERHHIPVHQPKTLENADEVAQLQHYQPDVLVVVAYGLLIPPTILELPKHGCINVHASILPRWRGAAPIQYAIKSGDEATGVTIMQMDAGLDTGDILAVKTCEIDFEDTASSLHDKLAKLGPPVLLDVLSAVESGRLLPQPQNEGESTYASKLAKSEAQIDWHLPAAHIDRLVRAFNPWPIAYTHVHDQTLRIWRAGIVHETIKHPPGTIVRATEEGIDVATGDGVLRLFNIQLPGGKHLPVSDVLHSKQAWFEPGVVLC